MERAQCLALVRHLQEILAYQQLATETFNDACAVASGYLPPGAEQGPMRASVSLSNPSLVSEYVIPALEKKMQILRLMEEKHKLASELAAAKHHEAYQEMTVAIRVMIERAYLQYIALTRWIRNPQEVTDTGPWDEKELSAVVRAVKALNDLIFKKLGLPLEEWLSINCDAFNSVRSYLGLPPLEKDIFCSRYFRGLAGETVRFFSE